MATIKEIAKLAGVSTATVSHVINKTRFVSEEITNKVLRVMEETNYRPNYMASSLRTQRTKTIGLLLPVMKDETSNVFFMQMMMGIESVLDVEGYSAVLGNTHENLETEKNLIEKFQNRMVDGLIIAPVCEDHAFIGEMADLKPTVFVDRKPLNLPDVDCVIYDAVKGSFEAVERMIKEGHQRIGILSGLLGKNTMADLRVQGYLDALAEYDIPYDESLLIQGESKREEGFRMMRTLVEKTDITAVFVSSNIMAMGAIEYLNQNPDYQGRISITVFDDYEWVNTCIPPVNTVLQDAYHLGEAAAKMMLERIENPDKAAETLMLSTQMIIRR